MSSDEFAYDTCQMRDCDRHATGNFTRKIYSAEKGEDYPHDVSSRPICWYHHTLELMIKGGTAGFGFGAIFAIVAWLRGVTSVSLIYTGVTVVAALAVGTAIKRLQIGQVIKRVR